MAPPILDLTKVCPLAQIKIHKTKPFFKAAPNPEGVPTLEQYVRRQFRFPLAKLTKTATWPTPTS
jgi:hypothetical protein